MSDQQIPALTVTKGIHNFRNFPKVETISNYTQFMEQQQQNNKPVKNNNNQIQQQASLPIQSSSSLPSAKSK